MKIDRLLTSVPMNKTAALVTSKGEQYVSAAKVRQVYWETCPGTIPVPDIIDDMTGVKRGRLVVVGLFQWKAKGKSKWLVRCSCSRYETRRRCSLLDKRNLDDSCYMCNHIVNLREQSRWLGTTEGRLSPDGIRPREDDRKTKSLSSDEMKPD